MLMSKKYSSNIKLLTVPVIFVVVLMLLVSFAPQQSNLPHSSANASQSSAQYSSVHPLAGTPTSYYVNFTESGFSNSSVNVAHGWNWYIAGGLGFNQSTGTTNSFQVQNGTYNFYVYYNSQYSYTMNPSSGTVYVNGNTKGITIDISFTNVTVPPTPPARTYDANFTVTNLPSVMPNVIWTYSVTINGEGTNSGHSYTLSTSGTNISFTGLQAGNYDFTISGTPFGTSLSPNSGSLTINQNTTVDLQFTLLKEYKVRFDSSGLTSTQSFNVGIYTYTGNPNSPFNSPLESNTSYPSMSYVGFNLPYGTYYFTVSDSSNGLSPTPSYGTIAVNGKNVAVNIVFSIPTSQSSYSVTFNVTNIPSTLSNYNFEFGVYISGNGYQYNQNYGSTISFSVLNGTYSFNTYLMNTPITISAGLSPGNGQFLVQGKNVLINLTLLPPEPLYKVKFVESGIPSGEIFGAWVNGNINETTVSSTSNYVGFTLPNGSYYYNILGVNGMGNDPSGGELIVNGGSVTIPVSFYPAYYMNFTLPNLPSNIPGGGFAWCLKLVNDVNGYSQTKGSSSNEISFSGMQNDPYSYSVASFGTYTITNPTGSATVNGSNVNVNMNISTQKSYTAIFTEKGLSSGTQWGVVINDGFEYSPGEIYKLSYSPNRVSAPMTYTSTLANGTYSLQGFVWTSDQMVFTSPFSITVKGKISNNTVTFTNSTSSPSSSSNSGALVDTAAGIGAGVAVGVGALYAYTYFRKRPPAVKQANN